MTTSKAIKLVSHEVNRQRGLAKLSKEQVISNSHEETADALAMLINIAQEVETGLMKEKAEVSA